MDGGSPPGSPPMHASVHQPQAPPPFQLPSLHQEFHTESEPFPEWIASWKSYEDSQSVAGLPDHRLKIVSPLLDHNSDAAAVDTVKALRHTSANRCFTNTSHNPFEKMCRGQGPAATFGRRPRVQRHKLDATPSLEQERFGDKMLRPREKTAEYSRGVWQPGATLVPVLS
jgi:hypothetical protein